MSASAEEPAAADHIAMLLHNHAAAASARRHGVGLFRTVLSDVRRAGGRVFAGSVALSLLGVVLTVAQVAVGALVLDALVDGHGAGLGPVGVPLAVLAALTVLGLAAAAAAGQLERLLGQLVLRDIERRILDVTAGVPLSAYETPAFLTLLTRVEHNAVAKPLAMVHGLVALTTGLAASLGLGVVLASVDPVLIPLLAVTALPGRREPPRQQAGVRLRRGERH